MRSQVHHQRGRASRSPLGNRRTIVAGALVVLISLGGGAFAVKQWLPRRSEGTAELMNAGSEGTTKASDAAVGAKKVALGRVAVDGNFAFKVTKVSNAGRALGTGKSRITTKGRFIVVSLVVKNVGKDPVPLLAPVQRLHNVTGSAFVPNPEAPSARSRRLWSDLAPAKVVTGILVFDVPKGTRAKSLELHGSGTSAGLEIRL